MYKRSVLKTNGVPLSFLFLPYCSLLSLERFSQNKNIGGILGFLSWLRVWTNWCVSRKIAKRLAKPNFNSAYFAFSMADHFCYTLDNAYNHIGNVRCQYTVDFFAPVGLARPLSSFVEYRATVCTYSTKDVPLRRQSTYNLWC